MTDEQRKARNRAYQRRYEERHPERRKASKAAWMAKHRDEWIAKRREGTAARAAQAKASKAKWEKANPDKVYVQRLRQRIKAQLRALSRELRLNYRVSFDEYMAIWEMQGGVCAICRSEQTVGRSKRLAVDHDHATGKLRALLCVKCNSAIGYFDENPALLRRAADYCERFNAQNHHGDWLSRVRRVVESLPEASREARRDEGVSETQPECGPAGSDAGGAGVADSLPAVDEGRWSIRALLGYLDTFGEVGRRAYRPNAFRAGPHVDD